MNLKAEEWHLIGLAGVSLVTGEGWLCFPRCGKGMSFHMSVPVGTVACL